MCYWQAAIMAVQVAGQVGSSVSAAKAQKEAMKANAEIMMQKANIDNANIRMQQVDAIATARQANTQAEFEKFQTMSMLNNVMSENIYEGRSTDRIKRGVSAQFTRQQADNTYNLSKDFARMYQEQLSNSLTAYQNAKMLQKSGPTRTSMAWSMLGQGAQGASSIYSAYKQGASK